MTVRPENPDAPGCYGSALAFKADSKECRECIFAKGCEPLHYQRRNELNLKFGITFKSDAKQGRKTRATPGVALTLTERVNNEIRRVEHEGIKLQESLIRGVNPFSPDAIGPKYAKFKMLYAVSHLLLKRPEVHRDILAATLAKRFNWDPGIADDQARFATQFFVETGVARERNNRLILKKAA